MKSIFSLLLIGMIPVAQASEEHQDPVTAGVDVNRILLEFRGQVAKDIFDKLPKDSTQAPKKNCSLPPNTIYKIKGGLLCAFSSDKIDPLSAYYCNLAVWTKNGKAQERKKYDMCDEPDP